MSIDPSFQLPVCAPRDRCPSEEADGGIFVPICTAEEPDDAGAPPAFCPEPSFPRPVLGSKPRPGLDEQSMTVKFIEGSHVRTIGTQLHIDPFKMLDEDPGLLRCAHLTVPGALCEFDRLESVLFIGFHPVITRVFTQPENVLDTMRAEGRADGGPYLDDENLFYTVQAPGAELSRVYDLFARSPIVDTVYWNPIAMPATP